MRFQLAETQRSRISNKAAMTSLSVTIDLHIVSVGIIERQSTNYAALPAKAEPYDACTGLKNMKNQQMMWRSRGQKHIFNENPTFWFNIPKIPPKSSRKTILLKTEIINYDKSVINALENKPVKRVNVKYKVTSASLVSCNRLMFCIYWWIEYTHKRTP